MPPTPRATTASSTTSSTSAAAAKELAELLANSQTTTIYLDADLNDSDAASLLASDPPLHAEFDQVRQQWAVRRATDEEVAEAAAAKASTSTVASSAA